MILFHWLYGLTVLELSIHISQGISCTLCWKISLFSGKADVNCENKQGMTPLFLASQNGEARVSQVLLDAGADPNFQYSQLQKQTPLIVATANELTNVVRVLLKVIYKIKAKNI